MPTFAVADPAYDALIIQARNGNFTPALTQLRQLPAERQTAGQVSDHLVIAGWAGQDAEVLKVYEAQGKNRNLNTQALAHGGTHLSQPTAVGQGRGGVSPGIAA
jgi:biofilm PGA synthesis protein PgaA